MPISRLNPAIGAHQGNRRGAQTHERESALQRPLTAFLPSEGFEAAQQLDGADPASRVLSSARY